MQSKSSTLKALPPDDEALIPANRLPDFIGVARQTLAHWRCSGQGPQFVKLGRRVFYRSGDVRAWVDSGKRRNTIAVDR